MRRVVSNGELARFMHARYEALAPEYGWDTQEASRVAFDELPPANRELMIAIASAVLDYLDGKVEQ